MRSARTLRLRSVGDVSSSKARRIATRPRRLVYPIPPDASEQTLTGMRFWKARPSGRLTRRASSAGAASPTTRGVAAICSCICLGIPFHLRTNEAAKRAQSSADCFAGRTGATSRIYETLYDYPISGGAALQSEHAGGEPIKFHAPKHHGDYWATLPSRRRT